MDIDTLIADLSSTDVARRRAAAATLSRDGAARAVIPLVQTSGDADEQVQEFAHAALEAVGPPPSELAAQLASGLLQAGPVGYWSATLLGRLAADAAPWVVALGQAIQQNSDASVRQRAAWALGQIGPAATAAIPALEVARQDADPRLARLSTEALQRITTAP